MRAALLLAGLLAGAGCAAWAAAQGSKEPRPVATVGTIPIPREDFERRAATGRAEFERRRGEKLSPELQGILERQILESLIRASLLVLEARRTGITVSDAEAEAHLKNDPFFNRSGSFDPARFQQVRATDPVGFRTALERSRSEVAGRKLAERIHQRHRPEDARVRALAERALSSATLDLMALNRFELTGEYPEPRESEVLAIYRAQRRQHPGPLAREAPAIRRRLRDEVRTHFEERVLRAFYEAKRDSLRGPGFRIRYVVADTSRLHPGSPSNADLERFYRAHLADYTSYDAATASIVSRPMSEVRDEIARRWSQEQRMLLAKGVIDGWMRAWRTGTRDRSLERTAPAREVGPIPAGGLVDTGLAGRMLTDSLRVRGMALGVGVIAFPRGVIAYQVHERVPDHLPTFEQILPVLAHIHRGRRAAEDEQGARALYDRDPQRFATGNVLHFTRILFEPPAPVDVPLTREEVERYHRDHIDRYSSPEQIRARHILISPEGAGEEADRAARREAEALLARLRAGEDFAALARTHSDDPPTQQQGGDLGYFSRGAMLEDFERAAFALKRGEISEPVKTEVGYHLIEVTDHVPMIAEPLVHLYSNVGADAAAEKGLVIARRRADSLYQAVRTPAQARAAAERLGMEVFSYAHDMGNTNYPDHLRPVMAQLEKLPPGRLYPGVVSLKAQGSAIQWVDSIAPPRTPRWEDVRARVIEAYVRDAGRRALDAKRAELDSMMAAGWSFDSLAALWGGALRIEGHQAGARIRGLGESPAIDSLVFGGRRAPVLDPGEVSEWLELPAALARVRLVDVQRPSPSQLAARIESERRLGLERNLYLYYEDLKKRHAVRIHDPRLRDVVLPPPPPENAPF